MSEIKFRAWDGKNSEMAYSDKEDCFYINKKGALFMYALPKSETGLETIYHRDYELMQYTGFKDKNGAEIYEGDIVSYGFAFVGAVSWSGKGSWALGNNLSPAVYMDTAEVIGNIYETPELLQQDNGKG